jgi:hypothetical protein
VGYRVGAEATEAEVGRAVDQSSIFRPQRKEKPSTTKDTKSHEGNHCRQIPSWTFVPFVVHAFAFRLG